MSTTDATPNAERGVQTLTMVLALPKPLLTINEMASMHWAAKGRHVKAQREAFGWHAKATLPADFIPLVGRVRLDVVVYPHKGQQEPDEGGKWEAVKSWVDGLQDAGVFAGGDDKVVVFGEFLWVKERRTGEVVLTLRPDAPR